jgi:Xaa-Pro aminopeptidase
MSHAHFLARRKRLLQTIGDGVAIVPTAPEVIRNSDATTFTASTATSGT